MTSETVAKKVHVKVAESKNSRSVKGLYFVAKLKDGHMIIESRLGDRSPKVVRRTSLVGKFPEVRHFSAPRTELKIDAEKRKKILALMSLA